MAEPDISSLPSLEDRRNILEASSRLAGETGQSKKAPEPAQHRSSPIYDKLLTRTEASRTNQTRPVTRSRPSGSNHSKRSTDAGKRRSRSFSAQQREPLVPTQLLSVPPSIQRRGSPSESSESWKRRSLSFDSQQKSHLLLIRQQSRSPSNESDDSTSSRSRRNNKSRRPLSDYSSSVSRTPSPVFDDEDDITDFESVTDMTEDDNDERFYGRDKKIKVLPAQGHGEKEQSTFHFHQRSDIKPQVGYNPSHHTMT